jgi:peptide/nickel transport system substrate-binding protein
LFRSGGAEELDAGTKLGQDLADLKGYTQITQKGGPTVLVPDSLNASSPWSNKNVRMAVEYAIDKEALAKAFGFGYGVAAYQMPNPASIAYNPNLTARKFDVAKAKQLLADAGYPTGFKSKIIANPAGLNKDVVVAIQAYLKAVGINVDLDFPESAQMQNYLSGTWTNALLYTPLNEWANYNTTLNFYFGVPVSTWFKSMKKPDNWADVFNASIHAPKPDAKLLQPVIAAAYDDEMVVPLVYSASVYILKDTLKGTGVGTRGSNFWWNPQDAYFAK